MSSKMPIVRQSSVLSLLIQIVVLTSFIIIFYQFDKAYYIYYGTFCFIFLTLILRLFIPKYHRKGISLFKKRMFDLAIPCFEKSYLFFSKHNWIDRYRFITMLSSSRISYTEMALLNIAFCQSQLGQKKKSIATYKKVLKQFKDSEIAASALKMLE